MSHDDSTVNLYLDASALEEQSLALLRYEQEKADREYARMIQMENMYSPESSAPRGRQSIVCLNDESPRGRRTRGNGNRRAPRGGRTGNGGAGGPVRRVPSERRSGGAGTASRSGGRAATRRRGTATRRGVNNMEYQNLGQGRMEFNGNRVQFRRGTEVIDITDATYFPDDDDDDDFVLDDSSDEIDVEESGDSSSESSSEDDDDTEPAPRPADYIQQLLNPVLAARDPSDRTYRLPANHQNLVIDLSDDDSDLDDYDFGQLRPEPNNITQPILDEDAPMYQRELNLYNDDNYDVPPARIPTHNGKPMEPDGTWGDCTMCIETPIKPQGCTKCLKIIGCADCISRWNKACRSAGDQSTCPLCRAPWGARPAVQLMKNIEKLIAKRKKEEAASSDSPGTSSSASCSSSR
ncbi:unnamed protein product [Caenorhabditis sp. 36 PRJEB53466]|nr:unnamed protein product [Caenorhabditis sp. 36 PRJEB53466]